MTECEWWRGCVIYQIYPRSFCDANADGIGDLRGIISRLDHIASLGVDAIWISPFFKSPMKDFGYDVSDYCQVDPLFGSLEDFQELLTYAHNHGIKVLIDQVWSHTSDQHQWFLESRINKTNQKADWYVWADPKEDGSAPNNWLSYFGGPAWSWDSRREQYYLHHFLKEQPTLNLWNPEVREAVKQVAAFWLDLGVDGFRLDVAHAYLSDPQLRDNPARKEGDPPASDIPASNPMSYQRRKYSMGIDDNLEWIEELRAHVNQWPERCLLAEAGGDHSEKVAASYVQTGKRFHLAYSFGLVGSDMTKDDTTQAIRTIEDVLEDGWICWSTSNHDFKRSISRVNPHYHDTDDIARYIMALGLTLRGSFCIYQGEELGLVQGEIAFQDLVDPYDIMLYPEHVGRDGCRTPIPWMQNAPHAGFSTTLEKTWLPICDPHLRLAVDTQNEDEDSVLNFYRAFLKWRKDNPAVMYGDFTLIDTDNDILAYTRKHGDDEILCLMNTDMFAQSFVLENKLSSFTALDPISYGTKKDGEIISFQPYGYAFLKKAA